MVEGGATEASLAMAIRETPVGKVFGDDRAGTHVLIVTDMSVTGETVTKPEHRQPPFRQNQVGKLLRACFQARHGKADSLQLTSGDLYLIFDGSRRGIHGQLANLFGTEDTGLFQKNKREVTVVYTEESVKARYRKMLEGHIQQEEVILQFTKDPMVLRGKPRLHFPGSNRGSILGPMPLEPYEEPRTWMLTQLEKRPVFGKANRVAVGGTGPATHPDEPGRAEAKGRAMVDKVEPVFYHEHPFAVDEEMVHGHDAVGIICLTAGSGRYAVLACKNKIPCTLVAMTPAHKELVLAYMERLVFNEFQVEGGPLHQAGLVEVLSKEAKKKENPMAKPAATKKLNPGKKEAQPETPKPNSAMDDLKKTSRLQHAGRAAEADAKEWGGEEGGGEEGGGDGQVGAADPGHRGGRTGGVRG